MSVLTEGDIARLIQRAVADATDPHVDITFAAAAFIYRRLRAQGLIQPGRSDAPAPGEGRADRLIDRAAWSVSEDPDWQEGDKMIICLRGADGQAGITIVGYTPETARASVDDMMVFLRMLGQANGLSINIGQIGRN